MRGSRGKKLYKHRENLSLLDIPKIGNFDLDINTSHLFNFLKSAHSQEQLWARSIEFHSSEFTLYRLIPVSKVNGQDKNLVKFLFKLRAENSDLFPGDKDLSMESTKKWIQSSLIENNNRILFLVVNSYGDPLAHLGIWKKEKFRFEIDNVIKDKACEIKGLMSEATKTLGLWAKEFLNIDSINLRVLDSNLHAVNFYNHLNFVKVKEIPMTISPSKDGFKTQEAGEKQPDFTYIDMVVNLNHWTDIPDTILTAGPSIGQLEVAYSSDAVKTGWNDHAADYLKLFENKFANYVEAKHAIPTDSCTSALHMALWSLGIGPGDEVIVPEITWVATANAVKYVGATPIFADVDKETWCIDNSSVESLITSRTKAVMPVHLYGYVGNLSSLENICKKNNLFLIQDAAPGIGSMHENKSVATFGDIACFSFQGAKLLVSGEGGVLTTNSKDIYEKAFKIGDSGRQPGTFWIDSYGKKMKMSNPTASLAVTQLQSAERQISQKKKINDLYKGLLANIDGLKFQLESENTRSIHWLTSIIIERKNFDREVFRKSLLNLGIDTRPVFPPISQYPIWDQKIKPQPNALRIGGNAINLPSGVRLSARSIEKVSKEILKLLEK